MTNVVSLTSRKKAGGDKPAPKKKGGGGPPPGEHDALAAAVADVNAEFAFLLMGGKAFVLREFQHPTLKMPTQDFLTVTAFKDWKAPDRFFDPEQDRMTGLGHMWLKDKRRRQYFGLTFQPEGGPEGWYNLWRGFAVEPAAPLADFRDHAKYFSTLHDHVLNNVAKGNRKVAQWVWAWCAHMFQRPTERVGVALILRGRQGVGKTALGDAIGSLLGPHYTLIDDPKHLVGSFNAHMASCLLLQADEAVWAGDKQAEGRLKSLVTSARHMVEKKNVDAEAMRNLVRLMMTSNNDWVVPAGMEERRFAVLDVGEDRMQDRDYFARLFGELRDGGASHLLSYLLAFPLDDVALAVLPRTDALFEQKLHSFEPHVAWWFDCLQRGAVQWGAKKWPEDIATASVYKSYLSFAERLNVRRPLTAAVLGVKIGQLVPARGFQRGKVTVEIDERGPMGELIHTSDGKVPTERVNGYRLPGIHACRLHFAALVRHEINWADDDLPPLGG